MGEEEFSTISEVFTVPKFIELDFSFSGCPALVQPNEI